MTKSSVADDDSKQKSKSMTLVPSPMKKEVYVADAIDNLQFKFKFRKSNKSKKRELQGD